MTGYRILIIDDSDDVHQVVGAYLKYSGYEVLHAANGIEGVNLTRKELPDLVLLDIQMPGMDGFRVLAEIKNDPRLTEIPVLFLSSLNRPNLKVKGLQMGADDYIVKPFDRAELMVRVTIALRRGERFRRLERTFSGVLGAVSVEELLQTMDLGGKTGRIDLPDIESCIEVSNRHIISARWKNRTGEEALYRIFLNEEGRFSIDFDFEVTPVDAPVGKIQEILMDAVVLLDELASGLPAGLTMGTRVSPGESPAGDWWREPPDAVWPMTVSSLLAEMNDDLRDNAALLTRAFAERALVRA